jgi:glycosyltransferase involved in cell wall biosynthesis
MVNGGEYRCSARLVLRPPASRVNAKTGTFIIDKRSRAVSTAISSPTCEHLFHVFPSFGIGGVPLRMVRIINHFGKRFRHTVMALDNNFEAAAKLDRELDLTLMPVQRAPAGALHAILRSIILLRRIRPNLLLTYNWGAIEWAMANRLSPVARHIHFEAGFGQREANAQIPRRVLFRRRALARCALVVVPSHQLEELAHGVWRLPAAQVLYVPNGVDTARFSAPVRDKVPGFTRRPGELVIGTVAPLRPEKNIGRLLRVFARLEEAHPLRLIIAGDGSERRSLEQLATALGIVDRVIFTGQVTPEAVLGTFDIFGLSSDTEQMPNALLEAMAASRAIAAVDVGDVKAIVCDGNREFIVARDDEAGFAAAITRLCRDADKREALGEMNRHRAATEYSQERMFSRYREIFHAGQAN